MAYANNERKGWLMRANPLGVGELSASKRSLLLELRERALTLMRTMAQEGFEPEPLRGTASRRDLEDRLVAIRKADNTLNTVWSEKARTIVQPALESVNKRYFQKLAGSLRFVDSKVSKNFKITAPGAAFIGPPAPARRYLNIPLELQDVVTETELKELKILGESNEGIPAFRKLILERDPVGLSATQQAILRFIHTRALTTHTAPSFGATDDFTLQLHLDSRMLATGQAASAKELLEGCAFFKEDTTNQRYHRFLDVSGIEPRDKRINIPVVLTPRLARKLESSDPSWASLILEISSTQVGVRLVTGKPKPMVDVENMFCVVGRDFGYTNTVSLSVARSTVALDVVAFQEELVTLTDKDSIKKYLTEHQISDSVEIVERVRFSGKAFLGKIAGQCKRIDGYTSRIDTAYLQFWPLKLKLADRLGLLEDELISREHKHPANTETSRLAREFFGMRGRIQDLKRARRKLYERIAQLKKNWFGFLANVEIALARKYNAAIVREDLTVEAIEKDSSEYKGRIFNKLINNGSKGQYQRRATDKFQWNGVPEIVIPSWYTSRACLRHAFIVEKKHRKGERIFLPCCNRHDHADEHAGDTIAQYAFLRPKLAAPG